MESLRLPLYSFLLLLFICFSSSATTIVTAKSSSKTSKNSKNSSSSSNSIIDSMLHDITVISSLTFDSKIRQFRNTQVSSVIFYSNDSNCQKVVQGEYNNLAKELKGMVTVAGVDCDEFPKLCLDNGITKYPTVMIFPINPIPPFVHQDAITKDVLSKQLMRLIPSHVQTLTPQQIDSFLTQTISLPKVVLFSEKSSPPVLLSALSNSFLSNIQFGFVDGSLEANKPLLDRWKVVKMPHLMLLKHDQKTPEVYKGKTMSFGALHDWLNVYSETFGLGGGFSDKEATASASKPWLLQRTPELTKESHNDICFSKGDKSKGLCVIYLKSGGQLSVEETTMIENLSQKFTSQLADRGATFRWMWMNMDEEVLFNELFETSPENLPSVVVFNPHKRLRFMKLSEDLTATTQNIKDLLDKITGGDARFKNVKGQQLPEFSERKADEAKKAEVKNEEL